jgi:protein-S-isoprenylcysteine O-methyltransferase Ste14
MTMIGFLLVLLGLGVGGWTASVLGWRSLVRADVAPSHPAQPVLVLAGPYRVVRHPRTLAVLLLVSGAVMMRGPLPFWLSGTIVAVTLLAAASRDRQLLARFGEAYRRYQRAVPFIVPGISTR